MDISRACLKEIAQDAGTHATVAADAGKPAGLKDSRTKRMKLEAQNMLYFYGL